MTNDVMINYSKYGSESIIDSVSFELLTDIILKLDCDQENKEIAITMSDAITDNTELTGTLTYDKLATFIRVLSQLKTQIK